MFRHRSTISRRLLANPNLDKEQQSFDNTERKQALSQAMSLITEEAPACFMWRHKLLWGIAATVDYAPLPDGRIYGLDMKMPN